MQEPERAAVMAMEQAQATIRDRELVQETVRVQESEQAALV
jgi:hypothetical protein